MGIDRYRWKDRAAEKFFDDSGCNTGANTVETMDAIDKNVDFHWK